MKKLAYAILLCASCATIPKSEQVKIMAAHDLQCAQSQVKTTPIDAKTMRVDACGKQVTYRESCPTEASTASTRCTWVATGVGQQASGG